METWHRAFARCLPRRVRDHRGAGPAGNRPDGAGRVLGQERISIEVGPIVGPGLNSTSRGRAGLLAALAGGVRADAAVYRPLSRAVRAVRRARIAGKGADLAALLASPSLLHHALAEEKGDPLFCLSHRYYLAKGLTPRERLLAARHHYQQEDRLYRGAYTEQVYQAGGLVLWSADSPLHHYDIVLQPGRDVAYEGGLSLALRMDGGCLCVLSFSEIPTRIFRSDPDLPETIHLVSRRHLTKDRDHQADYNKAFHRSAPAHMVFAALEGLILAQGRRHVLGIAPERHPSDREELNPRFRESYAEFWASLGGRSLGAAGYLVELPMRLSPLHDLDAAKRKRALQRRAHLDAVRQTARARIAALLLPQRA